MHLYHPYISEKTMAIKCNLFSSKLSHVSFRIDHVLVRCKCLINHKYCDVKTLHFFKEALPSRMIKRPPIKNAPDAKTPAPAAGVAFFFHGVCFCFFFSVSFLRGNRYNFRWSSAFGCASFRIVRALWKCFWFR